MSEENTVKIPTFLLPIGAAAVSLAVAWGVLQSNVAHATEQRERIEQVAKEAIENSQKNGQAIAVTDAKLEAIVASLEKQEQISAKTNEQISVLVQALLKGQN
tara:strand:+ start:1595 stop:1903 length:309 start_codon:yes stop_codon:yes gene_type:complete